MSLTRREFLKWGALSSLGLAAGCLELQRRQVVKAFELPHQVFLPDIKANFDPYLRRFETLEQVQTFVDTQDRIAGFSDLVDMSQRGIVLERGDVAQIRRERLSSNLRSWFTAIRPEEYDYLLGNLPEGVTPLDWVETHINIINEALEEGAPLVESLSLPFPQVVLNQPLLIAPVSKEWEFFPHATYYSNFWGGDTLTTRYPFSEDASWVASPYADGWTRVRNFSGRLLRIKFGDVHEGMHAFFKAGDLYHLMGKVLSPQNPEDPNYLNLSYIYFCLGDMMSYPATPPELFAKPRLGPLSVAASIIHAQRGRSSQYEGYQEFSNNGEPGLYSLFPENLALRFTARGEVLPREQIIGLRLLSNFERPPEPTEVNWDEQGRLILSPDKLAPWHAIIQIEKDGQRLNLPFPRYLSHFLLWLNLEPFFEIEIKEVPQELHPQRIEVLFEWELEEYLENSMRSGWGEVARTSMTLRDSQKVYVVWTAPLTTFSSSSQQHLLAQVGLRKELVEEVKGADWQREIEETEKALGELRKKEGEKFIPKL